MNNISTVNICAREDLSRKDINIKEIVENESIVKSKRITDQVRHSHVPPKVQNKHIKPKNSKVRVNKRNRVKTASRRK